MAACKTSTGKQYLSLISWFFILCSRQKRFCFCYVVIVMGLDGGDILQVLFQRLLLSACQAVVSRYSRKTKPFPWL